MNCYDIYFQIGESIPFVLVAVAALERLVPLVELAPVQLVLPLLFVPALPLHDQ